VPAIPAKIKAETRSLLVRNKPKVIAIANMPNHHKTGVPIANISCEQLAAAQLPGF